MVTTSQVRNSGKRIKTPTLPTVTETVAEEFFDQLHLLGAKRKVRSFESDTISEPEYSIELELPDYSIGDEIFFSMPSTAGKPTTTTSTTQESMLQLDILELNATTICTYEK